MGQVMCITDLAQLLAGHVHVTNDDVARLVEVANQDLDSVWVREIFYDKSYPLSQIAHGRFLWRREGDYQVMVGFDCNNVQSKIRIVDDQGSVELSKWEYRAWTTWWPPAFGSVRILLPRDLLCKG